VFLTEFTSPYSLNKQRGWHTSKLQNTLYTMQFKNHHASFVAQKTVINVITFSTAARNSIMT